MLFIIVLTGGILFGKLAVLFLACSLVEVECRGST